MWQDALALLIVVIAAVALLRLYLPAGWFRFGVRRGGDGSAQNAPPDGGCGGCASGSSCTKVQVKVSGTVSFNGEDRDIERTSTHEIKDVGTTEVKVPEEASKALGS